MAQQHARSVLIVFLSPYLAVGSSDRFSQSCGAEQHSPPPNTEPLRFISPPFAELTVPPHIQTYGTQWRRSAAPTTEDASSESSDLGNRRTYPSDISFVIDSFQDLSVAQELPQTDLSDLLYGFEEVNISQPVADNDLSPLLDSFQNISFQDATSPSGQHGDDNSAASSPVFSPDEVRRVIESLQRLLLRHPDLATDMLMQCPDAFPSIDSVYWRQLVLQTAN